MNTEFYRLIGTLKTVIHFIEEQYHDPTTGKHDAESKLEEGSGLKLEDDAVNTELGVLGKIMDELLREQAKISHAYFDFRRALSVNAEAFYHAIEKLRRKAPEWQIMDEDLLLLIDDYQSTASGLFFGGGGDKVPPIWPPSSSS